MDSKISRYNYNTEIYQDGETKSRYHITFEKTKDKFWMDLKSGEIGEETEGGVTPAEPVVNPNEPVNPSAINNETFLGWYTSEDYDTSDLDNGEKLYYIDL